MGNFKPLFIKIGELEHLKLLQKEGLLYCNTLQYFANLKDEQGRGDILENVIEITFYEDAKMYLISEDLNKMTSFDISGSHKYKRVKSHCGNLYCLYALKLNDTPLGVQKLNIDSQLGKYALIIEDSTTFLERAKTALNNNKLAYQGGYVEYNDFKEYSGKKSFFQKDDKYKHQNEYRILINYQEEKELQLRIGSIEDISKIVSMEELAKWVLIRPSPKTA